MGWLLCGMPVLYVADRKLFQELPECLLLLVLSGEAGVLAGFSCNFLKLFVLTGT
jgi:hypothetical protein